jgi:hypothetical protein
MESRKEYMDIKLFTAIKRRRREKKIPPYYTLLVSQPSEYISNLLISL